MRVREKRRFAYSSVHRRVGRWLAAGSLNLSGLLQSRRRDGRLDAAGDEVTGEDDGNGCEGPGVVDQRGGGEFQGEQYREKRDYKHGWP